MAKDWTLDFVGVDKMEAPAVSTTIFASPGWEVNFEVRHARVSYEVKIFVDAKCPPEDVVKQAMHRFHLQMTAMAEETVPWRLNALAEQTPTPAGPPVPT